LHDPEILPDLTQNPEILLDLTQNLISHTHIYYRDMELQDWSRFQNLCICW